VPIPPDVVTRIGDPSYVAASIPAGTYAKQDADVPTAAIVNILVTHAGVSDELAYQMTKLMFQHLGELRAAHAAAKEIALDRALHALPIPLHPGAERYYRETGLVK
jgi:uncharacterized protein